MVYSPVPAIRTSSRCCLGESLGRLPRSLPWPRPCLRGCASGAGRLEFGEGDEDVEEHLAHGVGGVVDLPAEGGGPGSPDERSNGYAADLRLGVNPRREVDHFRYVLPWFVPAWRLRLRLSARVTYAAGRPLGVVLCARDYSCCEPQGWWWVVFRVRHLGGVDRSDGVSEVHAGGVGAGTGGSVAGRLIGGSAGPARWRSLWR